MNSKNILRRGTILILITVILVMSTYAEEKCADYCSRGVYYFNGFYDVRESVCKYDQLTCRYGCDDAGKECADSTTTTTRTTSTTTTTTTRTTSTTTTTTTRTTSTTTSLSTTTSTLSECADYCSRGVYYFNGFYDVRESVCRYDQLTCRYGCDDAGKECADSTTTTTLLEDCTSYCSRGVYFFDGVYNRRSGVCEYKNQTCVYGCDSLMNECTTAPAEYRTELSVKRLSTNTYLQQVGRKNKVCAEIEYEGEEGLQSPAYIKWYVDKRPYERTTISKIDARKTKKVCVNWTPEHEGVYSIKAVLGAARENVHITKATASMDIEVLKKISESDSDGDGVKDYMDLCPDTPSKVEVGGHGCPPCKIDTDGANIYKKGSVGYFIKNIPKIGPKGKPIGPNYLQWEFYKTDECSSTGKQVVDFYCDVDSDDCVDIMSNSDFINLVSDVDMGELATYYCILHPSSSQESGTLAYQMVSCLCGCKNGACLPEVDGDEDGIVDCLDDDLDGDGVDNSEDNCLDINNPGQEDYDGDGLGDMCDVDDDGDGCSDDYDDRPMQYSTDLDGDGLANDCDSDDDGDGCVDEEDKFPYTASIDVDADGLANDCDKCVFDPENDADNDMLCAGEDNCNHAYNPYQVDSDNDLVGDACEGCAWTVFDSRKVCNPVGVPDNTPCTAGWPEHQGQKIGYNEKNYACDLYEVARDDMLKHAQTALECCDYYAQHGVGDQPKCHIWTKTAYIGSGLSFDVNYNNIKRCVSLYLIYGLGSGDPPEYMHKYFTNEVRCNENFGTVKNADCGECFFPEGKVPYICIPGAGAKYQDAVGLTCEGYVSNYPDGWESDTNLGDNTCRFSDLPPHVSMNIIQTGTCVDYSTVLTTLLRLSGYGEDEVYSTDGPGHAFNLVKFPGDKDYHFIDTVGNIIGYTPGGRPQTSYDYSDTNGCKYCEYDGEPGDHKSQNDMGKFDNPGVADVIGCPCPANLVPVERGGTLVVGDNEEMAQVQDADSTKTKSEEAYGVRAERIVADRLSYGKATTVILRVTNVNQEAVNVTLHQYISGGQVDEPLKRVRTPAGVDAVSPPYIEYNVGLGGGESKEFKYHLQPNMVGDLFHPFCDVQTAKGSFTIPTQMSEVACVPDGSCDVSYGENYLTCPSDCSTGSEDNMCDGITDGVCDPDCISSADGDCRIASMNGNIEVEPGSATGAVVFNGKSYYSAREVFTLVQDDKGGKSRIQITLDHGTGQAVLASGGVGASTQQRLSTRGGRLYVSDSVVLVTPDKASSRLADEEGVEVTSSELIVDQGRAYYKLTGMKDARILWLLSAKMEVEARVDAEIGEIGDVKKPWWSILA
ncbi:MAG: thrombospondin type 3 repeat-containing protein [Candidatus Altiarchaeota archaeon]|nr:thrombospondin type 3 repeat-containing protein [Candidatus Altiarchaeota archaeon]